MSKTTSPRQPATVNPSAPIALQRHASFEHTLLGNTPPAKLGEAAVKPADRDHLIQELWRQTMFFQSDAGRDPRAQFPELRWIQLRGSKLWLSYGELNALADYLPEAPRIDSMERKIVEPVLQRMRRDTSAQFHQFDFSGQASAGNWEVVKPVAMEKALDRATASLGTQRYFGLLTRNACHFAPYSWHRWARFHEEASGQALTYFQSKDEKVPIKDVDTATDEHLRQAWLNNGYGDHFLQDSFAAGHLVNKTLVMQWFVDYVNELKSSWWDLLGRMWWGDDTAPWYGVPDEHVMSSMGSRQQPTMGGRPLYSRPIGNETVSSDRSSGKRSTDPQSARERLSYEGRMAGSGVNATTNNHTREQNYQAYQRFLNSSFLNLAAGATHDYFNERGLVVSNERGDTLHVGGDNTLLTKSGQLGASVAAEAAQLSQRAINELANTGATAVTTDSISKLFPTKVWVGSASKAQPMPLEAWHDQVLHDICRREIFPDVVDSFNSKVARAGQSELVEGGPSDAPSRPPVPPDRREFVPPGPRS